MQPVTLLTYPVAHRKTYDLMCALKAHGVEGVSIIAVPFTYEKKYQPMIKHRPTPPFNLDTEQLAKAFGYDYDRWRYASYSGIGDRVRSEVVVIAGATLLPQELIQTKTVINSHPGLIPYTRGLDAVKWAIWRGDDVGVTVHRVTDVPDCGPIYAQETIVPGPTDSFHSIAARAYETEIRLLVNVAITFDGLEPRPAPSVLNPVDGTGFPMNRRMPHKIESLLPQAFEQWRLKQLQCGFE